MTGHCLWQPPLGDLLLTFMGEQLGSGCVTNYVIGPDVALRLAHQRAAVSDVALTQLQADAFVTLDQRLARAVTELVRVAPIEELY